MDHTVHISIGRDMYVCQKSVGVMIRLMLKTQQSRLSRGIFAFPGKGLHDGDKNLPSKQTSVDI